MTKPHYPHRRSPEERRQFLQQHSSRRTNRMAEVVGGTTAEVAAVCCCFPCAVVDLMVLTIVKVPAGLCRKVMRKKRRRRLIGGGRGYGVNEEEKVAVGTSVAAATAEVESFMTPAMDEDVVAFENEMWEKFCESGFWRSPSEDNDD